MLQLRTGQTLALVGTVGRRGLTLLEREPHPPQQTRTAFSQLTGYPADQLIAWA